MDHLILIVYYYISGLILFRMEDPVNQLANYRLQLGQVEAALTGDPENEELLNLKKDLDEIITITAELVDDTKRVIS